MTFTLQLQTYARLGALLQEIADLQPRDYAVVEGEDNEKTHTSMALLGLVGDVEPTDDDGGLCDESWTEDFIIGVEVRSTMPGSIDEVETVIFGLAQMIFTKVDEDVGVGGMQDLTERARVTLVSYMPGAGTIGALSAIGLAIRCETLI